MKSAMDYNLTSFFFMNRTSNDFCISLNGGLTEKISIDGKMDQRLYKNSYKYILTELIGNWGLGKEGNLVLGKKVKKKFSLFVLISTRGQVLLRE